MAATVIDTTAIAAIVIGLGGTVAAMVYPIKCPNAPKWAVNLSWWGGLSLVFGGVLYLVAENASALARAARPAFEWSLDRAAAIENLPGFWLAVTFFVGLAVGTWLIPLIRKTIREKAAGKLPAVDAWLSPLQAMEEFVDPVLRLERHRAQERVEALRKRIEELELGGPSPALDDARAQLKDAEFVAEKRRIEAIEAVVEELAKGKLVGRGLKITKRGVDEHESVITGWKIRVVGQEILNPEKRTSVGYFGVYRNVSIGKVKYPPD